MAKQNKKKRQNKKNEVIKPERYQTKYKNKKEKKRALEKQKKLVAKGDKDALFRAMDKRIMDELTSSYLYAGNRTDELPKEKDSRAAITKKNSLINIQSRVHKYLTWAYENKGVTHEKDLRSEYALEYVKYMSGRTEDDIANAVELNGGNPVQPDDLKSRYSNYTIRSHVSAIGTLRAVLEEKHRETFDEQKSIRIIDREACYDYLRENDLQRDIEDVKKSSMITNEQYEQIYERLSESAKPIAEFQKETGTRIGAALRTRKADLFEDHVHSEHGVKAGKKYDTYEVNQEYLNDLREKFEDYKEDRGIFDGLYTRSDGTNLKDSTIQNYINDELKVIGKEMGIDNLSTHSFRRLAAQNTYDGVLDTKESDVDALIKSRGDHYEKAFRKELHYINKKRKANRPDRKTGLPQTEKSLENFQNVLDSFTHEEKAALIASLETGHNRIAIMEYYIERMTARKTKGANVKKD